MRPWIIDADDIDVTSGFNTESIERTPSIQEFLSGGSARFMVTGTKGYGKTLLLKAKRMSLAGGIICVPTNSLLDKPIGDKIFSRSMLDLLSGSTQHWRRIWRVSICAAALKRVGAVDGLSDQGPLDPLLANPHLNSVIDFFVNILDLKPGHIVEAAAETDRALIPRLRNIGTPIAVFIDSVDEYFNKHIIDPNLTASAAGEISSDIWYLSQMSLLEAAYELRRVTHHLKVYATIRKEAYARLVENNPMAQQYAGSVLDLTYSKAELREIFCDNIRAEPRSNLVDPPALQSNPLEAFLGTSEVLNGYTGEAEEVFDYIYRHTFQRPRDLMTIGSRLSTQSVGNRRKPETIKRMVNDAATKVANEYIAEIEPHLGDVHLPVLWSMLPGPILAPAEVVRVADQYMSSHRSGPHNSHRTGEQLLTLLYTTGLLGYTVEDVAAAKLMQRFAAPGERTFDPDATRPASCHYLIHPALIEVISSSNRGYSQRIDRVNIIGNERPWLSASPSTRTHHSYVLRADIKGFSRFMVDPDAEARVRDALNVAVETHAVGALYHRVTDGDSVLIVNNDAERLIACAHRIMEDLHRVEGHPSLRVAIVHGPVQIETRDGDPVLRGGDALRLAARIEPRVQPNEVWVDRTVKDHLDQVDAYYTAEPITPDELDVSKPNSGERAIRLELYRVIKRI